MADDTLGPPAARIRVVRGDWSFMVESTNEEEEPQDGDEREEDQPKD